MNKSTFEGGKWCPRKFNWKKWFVYAFVYQGLAQALQHPAAVGHSVLVTMYCHVIKSTSYGGKCGVWEDVTGKVMCTHFFLQTRRVTKKENNNRFRRWCIMSSPTQCRYPRCVVSNADLLRASSRRIAWRFLWKATSYTQLLWVCCCGLVIIISIFAGSVESLSKG